MGVSIVARKYRRVRVKISSKKEFHSLVHTLQCLLADDNVPIKTTRAQELLSRSLGFKSSNGLLASLPTEIDLTDKSFDVFEWILQEKHQADHLSGESVLRHLERDHKSYSTTWGSDAHCYPRKLDKNENYWYLTHDGWIQWRDMDFGKMKVELNIYKVVQSSYSPFLGEGTPFGSARPIWAAMIASDTFEAQAAKLENEHGDMPSRDLMFAETGQFSQSF